MEDFEEKIGRLGSGEKEEDGNSWLDLIVNSLYNQSNNDIEVVEEEGNDEFDDYVESPVLDTGMAKRESKRSRRSTLRWAKNRISSTEKKEQSCGVALLQCLNPWMENGVLAWEQGILSTSVRKGLYQIVKKGGLTSPWSALLTFPQVDLRCLMWIW